MPIVSFVDGDDNRVRGKANGSDDANAIMRENDETKISKPKDETEENIRILSRGREKKD